jgi:hypothetical protein
MFVESDSSYRHRPGRLGGVLRLTSADRGAQSLEHPSSPWVIRRSGVRRRPARSALFAWWHALELDRQLAAGADPRSSAVLAMRARRITAARSRRRISGGLAGALSRAQGGHPGFTAAVRSDAREVLTARTVLTALAARLRAPEPVAPQGVAMLLMLLTDGTSPLYRPGAPGALGSRLRAAAVALEPNDRDAVTTARSSHDTPAQV